jgi:hypothetical protein
MRFRLLLPLARRVAVLLVLASAALSPAPAQSPAPAAAASDQPAEPAPPAAPPLRSVRIPIWQLGELPPPTVPEVFEGFPDAPPFTVVSRKPELPLYPCNVCHNLRKTDFKVRTFKVAMPPDGAPHAGVLRHGKGQMWCLDCHNPDDRQYLRTLNGTKIDFDDSPRQCGQCHGARYRDWAFGAHGKRVANWTGERQIYVCTQCHDPHNPTLKPGAPSKPPTIRAGLQPMDVARHPVLLPWQRMPQGSTDGSQPKH